MRGVCGGGEMAHPVKERAAQAGRPEFDPSKPRKGVRKELAPPSCPLPSALPGAEVCGHPPLTIHKTTTQNKARSKVAPARSHGAEDEVSSPTERAM